MVQIHIWAVRLGVAQVEDMGTTRIMDAVTKLNRHVRDLALSARGSKSGGATTPAGEGQISSGKKKKASTLGAGVNSKWLTPLLAHVNLLLVVYGGASLATAARLRWDPSTYVAVRELLPAEYVAVAAGAAAGGLLLLLLPHLAVAGLLAARPRLTRILLLVYAGAMLTLVLCELVLGAWLAWRLWVWLDSDAARQLFDVIELRKKIKPSLQFFGRWFQAPLHLDNLIKEAEEDAPRNLYVAVAAGAVLALLQPLAIALALCVARRAPHAPGDENSALAPRPQSASAPGDSEKAPLDARALYNNEKLVVV